MVEGESRRLDIVAQVKLKETDSLIIIHIEPQSYVQKNFHERMYLYYNLLYQRYRLPIVPVAIFSYGEKWDIDTFSLAIMNVGMLKFRYLTIHLKSLNWREFIRKDNPITAALLSKVDYTKKERIQVKLEFLRILTRLEVNEAEHRLLYGFFESYLTLTDEEEAQLMREAERFLDVEKF